jgi:hypothetical protein
MKEKRAESDSTKKAVKTIQSKVEKTTLGDLSALVDLKKKMDDGNIADKKSEVKTVSPMPSVEKKEEVKPVKAEEPGADTEVEENKNEEATDEKSEVKASDAPVEKTEEPAADTDVAENKNEETKAEIETTREKPEAAEGKAE